MIFKKLFGRHRDESTSMRSASPSQLDDEQSMLKNTLRSAYEEAVSEVNEAEGLWLEREDASRKREEKRKLAERQKWIDQLPAELRDGKVQGERAIERLPDLIRPAVQQRQETIEIPGHAGSIYSYRESGEAARIDLTTLLTNCKREDTSHNGSPDAWDLHWADVNYISPNGTTFRLAIWANEFCKMCAQQQIPVLVLLYRHSYQDRTRLGDSAYEYITKEGVSLLLNVSQLS